MVHIHHIAGNTEGFGGSSSSMGGTVRLRCLHGARGSGIVRVACLQETPLAFAQDASGRIVAYDLVSGSMLGVLALDREEQPGGGGVILDGHGFVESSSVAWTGGGDRIAVAIPAADEEEPSANKLPSPDSCSDRLGVWSATDILWALSPGLRGAAGEQRPEAAADVAGLFYELGPTRCKGIENYASASARVPHHIRADDSAPPTRQQYTATSSSRGACSQQSSTPPPRPPVAGQPRRAAPSHRDPQSRSSNYVKGGGGDGGGNGGGNGGGGGGGGGRGGGGGGGGGCIGGGNGGGGGSGGSSGSRNGPRGVTKVAVNRTPNTEGKSSRCQPRLTEGNVARLLVGGRGATAPLPGKSGAAAGGWMAGDSARGVGGVGTECTAWGGEVGAAGRVQQYLETRQGERAARQARLSDVARNLLQAL